MSVKKLNRLNFRSGVQGNMSARKKFLLYNLYGWGVPIVLTLFLLIFQTTKIIPEDYRPNIGKKSCFFDPGNVNVYRNLPVYT